MPIVELDDGTELEFPDDMSVEEIKAVIDKQYGKKSNEIDTAPIGSDKFWGSPLGSVLLGASTLVTGPLRAGAAAGGYINEKLGIDDDYSVKKSIDEQIKKYEEANKRGKEEAGREGFDWWNLAGAVGSPLNFVKTGAEKVVTNPTLLRNAYEAGKTGLVYGLGEAGNAEDLENAVLPTAETVVISALAPVFGRGVSAGIDTVSGFNWLNKLTNNAGNERLVKKAANRIAGKNKQAIIDALSRNSDDYLTKNETVGDALTDYVSRTNDISPRNIIKLESDLSRTPEGNVLAQIGRGQSVAREKVLNDIAGTPEFMKEMESLRRSGTEPLKKLAEKLDTSTDMTDFLNKIDDYIVKNKADPSVLAPLKKLRNTVTGLMDDTGELPLSLSDRHGISIEDFGDITHTSPGGKIDHTVQQSTLGPIEDVISKDGVKTSDLLPLRSYIDSLIKAPSKGGDTYDVKALIELKKNLDDAIAGSNDAYAAFKNQYKELSKPINRAEIGGVLRDKLLSPSGNETAGSYLRALDDTRKTIKEGTGFDRGSNLDTYFSKEDISNIEKIAREMERSAEKKRLAGSLGKTDEIADPLRIPQLLDQRIAIANAILGRTQKSDRPELVKTMSDLLADKAKFADALNSKDENKRKIVNEILMRMQAAGMSSQLGEQ